MTVPPLGDAVADVGMCSTPHQPVPFTIREATEHDNEALIALAASCPMRGALSLRVDRNPDFFALSRLEGERLQIGVAERGGAIVGCAAWSERMSYVHGAPVRTGYASDLKVHPAHRDGAVADALSRYTARAARRLPAGSLAMITVLSGNTAMERRLCGPRGLPRFVRLGTIRSHAVSILWRRRVRGPAACIRIDQARWTDVDEMAALWRGVAPLRQFAPALDAGTMASWIRAAPGLGISSYALARSSGGELLGFFALWDQSSFKQMIIESYSARLSIARHVFNALAPVIRAEPLPAEREPLRLLTAAHICVPGDRPEVLRALVARAHNDLCHSSYSLFNVGLDVRDPLTHAMRGLLAQPTDIDAYVARTGVPPDPESLSDRPLHYEIALV